MLISNLFRDRKTNFSIIDSTKFEEPFFTIIIDDNS